MCLKFSRLFSSILSFARIVCLSLRNLVDKYAYKPAIGFYRTISSDTIEFEYTTFSQLAELTINCAGGLAFNKISTGDHIIFYGFNSVEFFIVIWAACNQGLIPVPISPFLSAQACNFICTLTQARVLVISPFHYSRMKRYLSTIPSLKFILLLDKYFSDPIKINPTKESKEDISLTIPVYEFTSFIRTGQLYRRQLRGPFVIESRDFDELACLFNAAGTTTFPNEEEEEIFHP